MRTGTIKVSGGIIGYIEETITINNQIMEVKLDQGDIVPQFDENIVSGGIAEHGGSDKAAATPRLGHKQGHEATTPRLGHKQGFHPKQHEDHEQASGGSYGKTGGGSGANYLGSERSRAAGVDSGPGQNLTHVETKAGRITVNKAAASDMAGAVDDLVEAGAPVGKVGSFAMRNIRGVNRISQHALGGAMDLFDQSGKGIISKKGLDWIKANPEKWRDIKAKHNLVGGEDFGDIGHVEWGGPGYGQRHYGGGAKPPQSGSGRHYGPGAPGEITNKTSPGQPVRGSWFSDQNTATGLSARTMPGIALPSRAGLGKMHEVTGPNGQKVLLPQIDVGPAKSTGRGVDISKAALSKLGYTEKNFPTDSQFIVSAPVGKPKMPTQDEPM